MLVGLTETMVPVPERARLCGLFAALSVKVSVAARAPAACGVKRTLTVHVEFTASVVPQVFEEIWKSVAFVPVIVIELMVSVAVPVFRTVTELVDEV
jgi:hypothetical protein